jgi:hypothetical protein
MQLLNFRFSLLQSLGETCTAVGFGLHRRTEYLLALADFSVKCFDIGKLYESIFYV